MANQDEIISRSLSHFLAIPWCAKRLKDTHNQVIHPPGRTPDNRGEEELWSTTFNTLETFPAFIAFYRKPIKNSERVNEVSAFVSTNHGVQGFPGMMHGGIVATLLDGTAGLVPGVNQQRGLFSLTRFVTAFLNTTYMRPVPVPSTLLLTARLVKHEGRKLLVEATIENDQGTVVSKAEVLFVETKSQL
ncbi:putative HotDog domain-containing protein [Seiridium unicorne]|uniref:HotDog domain-containing protein n=1 Tax=Seiridium unicorne TaxID=138068 RepID=A0ABR2UX96_9PEZI